MLKLACSVVAAGVALAGCTGSAGYMSLAAVTKLDGTPEPVARGVMGYDCENPRTNEQPSIGLAIARALNHAGHGANALVDVDVDMVQHNYVFWARTCIRVRGDAVRIGRLQGR